MYAISFIKHKIRQRPNISQKVFISQRYPQAIIHPFYAVLYCTLKKAYRLSTYCQWKGNPFYKLRYVKTKKWNILFLEERMYKTDAWYMIYGHMWYVSYITISDIWPLFGIPIIGTAVETLGRISLTISLKTTRANKTVTPEKN